MHIYVYIACIKNSKADFSFCQFICFPPPWLNAFLCFNILMLKMNVKNFIPRSSH